MAHIIPFRSSPDYTGKLLSINPESPLAKFQCRGIAIFRSAPALIPPSADMQTIHTAVQKGELIECTTTGIKSKNADLDAAGELGDTDKKIFTLRTKEGIIIVTPETAEQAQKMEEELQKTGQIKLSNYPNIQTQKHTVPHLTGITVTDL